MYGFPSGPSTEQRLTYSPPEESFPSESRPATSYSFERCRPVFLLLATITPHRIKPNGFFVCAVFLNLHSLHKPSTRVFCVISSLPSSPPFCRLFSSYYYSPNSDARRLRVRVTSRRLLGISYVGSNELVGGREEPTGRTWRTEDPSRGMGDGWGRETSGPLVGIRLSTSLVDSTDR